MNEELALCAQVNFENLEKSAPFLKEHPYYIIAKAQLDEALGGETVEVALRSKLKQFDIHVDKCGKMSHCFIEDAKWCVCGEKERG